MKKRNNTGFTLVEILLATIIAALVGVIALSAFRNLTRSRETLQEYSEIMAHGRYALTQIREDLASFRRSVDLEHTILEGRSDQSSGGAADRLRMYIVSDRKVHENENEGDIYEVEYGLSYSRRKNTLFLHRRCAAVEDVFAGNNRGVLTRVARYINELKFEYYDGSEWHRQWLNRESLPRLVRVSMVLNDPDGKGPPLALSQAMSLEPLPSRLESGAGTTEHIPIPSESAR